MKREIVLLAAFLGASLHSMGEEILAVDRFDHRINLIGGKHNCYQSQPSKAVSKIDKEASSEEGVEPNRYLKIRFKKEGTGGKYGKGGWCGWYTLLYDVEAPTPEYLKLDGQDDLVFRVKGEEGGEVFRINLKDKKGEDEDATPPPINIGKFLPDGEVTTEWQEARIPLDIFVANPEQLASFSINFEGACYSDGAGSGTIYIDDLLFE